MRKLFLLTLAIVLLFSQTGLSAVGESDSKRLFDFDIADDATKQMATIQLFALNDELDIFEVILPNDVSFSEKLTLQQSQDGINISYDEQNHKVLVSRAENERQNLSVNIVLIDLAKTMNDIKVRGKTKDYKTDAITFTFTVSDKKSKNNESRLHTNSLITPFSGNLNVDISLTPKRNTVLSGNVASYNLILKVTGSRTEYTNARVVVDLPITAHTSFIQDLNELVIDGVTPTYDASTHQLIYEFDSIKSGRSYETTINIHTENGISPNGAQLVAQASFEADNQPKITDDAVVKIDASSAVSVTKQYKETRLSGTVRKAPFPGSFTIWDIKVSIPKKDVGQMFLKEGSKIVITDTFSNGLRFYDVMNNTPQPEVFGNTLKWEFNAPTFAEQMEADGEFFTANLRVRLQVNNNNDLIGSVQENNVTVNTTFIDDKIVTNRASDSITIVNSEQANGEIEGTRYVPNHFGPADGKGGVATVDERNKNPQVYDDALLRFDHGIAPLPESEPGDFQQYTTIYRIDPNLILNKIRTPGGFVYRPNASFPAGIPLAEEPRFNIVASVNGVERILVTNAETAREYTRKDLGLSDSDVVEYIKYDFTFAPSGMLNVGVPRYYFEVKKGFIGEVVNTFNVYGIDANGNLFNKNFHTQGRNTIYGPRSATIVPRPVNQPPIGEIAIELLDHDGGEVSHGENRMKITFSNSSSSTLTINEPLEAVVLLPAGVTLNTTPNATFTDKDGYASEGIYEIVTDNYNGTGRQLVKIKWNDDRIRIGGNVTAELDVSITEGAPNSLQFDVYGFSGEEELRVPSSSGTNITDTILQTDIDDLNGDSISNQPRLKSGNIYTIRGKYDIQTEKLVKGALDNDFTHFGHTTPNGPIEYQVKLTNTTGANISKMTLIDVLPSVGDLGITDNIERGSLFTPKMTNSIVLPAEWQDKVNVFYSTAKNPKRDDLTKHTIYPDTTTQLTNPDDAEEPNWVTESEVTDWSNIHSFKIELKEGVEWIHGQDMLIQFAMQAPSELEVDRSVLDRSVDPTERAAWNSFAVATDHGQPVEPLRVGVYMDYDVEDPQVEKTVNDSKASVKLINWDEQFTWKVDYEFGNYTSNWESVVLRDEINELLEIVQVKVVDQNEQDVTSHGTLDTTNNVITFTLNKQNNSFAYLKDQTYTLIIESKIKNLETDEQLEPLIQSGGIPNTAELIVDNNPILSNEVKIIPPVLGEIQITKIDEETGDILAGAQFELWKCSDEQSPIEECNLIASSISDENEKMTFTELPLGFYKLVETKAPEGYRILKKPIDIQLLDKENRVITMEVENRKSGWELPMTGGIGTYLFYVLGALLMIGAAFMWMRRKKA